VRDALCVRLAGHAEVCVGRLRDTVGGGLDRFGRQRSGVAARLSARVIPDEPARSRPYRPASGNGGSANGGIGEALQEHTAAECQAFSNRRASWDGLPGAEERHVAHWAWLIDSKREDADHPARPRVGCRALPVQRGRPWGARRKIPSYRSYRELPKLGNWNFRSMTGF
jgi:hypothetical protein